MEELDADLVLGALLPLCRLLPGGLGGQSVLRCRLLAGVAGVLNLDFPQRALRERRVRRSGGRRGDGLRLRALRRFTAVGPIGSVGGNRALRPALSTGGTVLGGRSGVFRRGALRLLRRTLLTGGVPGILDHAGLRRIPELAGAEGPHPRRQGAAGGQSRPAPPARENDPLLLLLGTLLGHSPDPGHDLLGEVRRSLGFQAGQGVVNGDLVVKIALAGGAGGHVLHELRPLRLRDLAVDKGADEPLVFPAGIHVSAPFPLVSIG